MREYTKQNKTGGYRVASGDSALIENSHWYPTGHRILRMSATSNILWNGLPLNQQPGEDSRSGQATHGQPGRAGTLEERILALHRQNRTKRDLKPTPLKDLENLSRNKQAGVLRRALHHMRDSEHFTENGRTG